jgi:L-ascorbate metabolism protein UlaG (beta-lactamase superfamily)
MNNITPAQPARSAAGLAPLRTELGAVGVTVLGGPTVVLDLGGLRLIVDPTFDPPGEYPVGSRMLVKTAPPAWAPERVGAVAAVLLSHDQHADNLDHGGRAFLATAPLVLTTAAAAARLGGTATALRPGESIDLARPDGATLRVTATPAQHGPPGTEHLTGPVIGFVVSGHQLPTVYVSGDNASLDVVRDIAARSGAIDIAVIFAGGAQTPLLGDDYLTLSSTMAAEAVCLLGCPRTIVVHVDGWAHVTEPRATVQRAFAAAGIAETLVASPLGTTVTL